MDIPFLLKRMGSFPILGLAGVYFLSILSYITCKQTVEILIRRRSLHVCSVFALFVHAPKTGGQIYMSSRELTVCI